MVQQGEHRWELDTHWKDSLVTETVAFSIAPAAAAAIERARSRRGERASSAVAYVRLDLRHVRPEAILQVCNGAGTKGGVNESDPTGMQVRRITLSSRTRYNAAV